jgi:hypothetical protein
VRAVFDASGLTPDGLAFVAATGYGRDAVKLAGKTVSELTCHARGAAWLCPGVRTVLDIGGQDCKALSLGAGGALRRLRHERLNAPPVPGRFSGGHGAHPRQRTRPSWARSTARSKNRVEHQLDRAPSSGVPR